MFIKSVHEAKIYRQPEAVWLCDSSICCKRKEEECHGLQLANYIKQLLDEVFVIPGIIKVEVSVISRSRRLRLITLTETLIISYITKTSSNNCFIIHCFKEINDRSIIAPNTVYFRHAIFLLRCP